MRRRIEQFNLLNNLIQSMSPIQTRSKGFVATRTTSTDRRIATSIGTSSTTSTHILRTRNKTRHNVPSRSVNEGVVSNVTPRRATTSKRKLSANIVTPSTEDECSVVESHVSATVGTSTTNDGDSSTLSKRSNEVSVTVDGNRTLKEMMGRIDALFHGDESFSTITKSGWCLRAGLKHIVSVDWINRQKQESGLESSDYPPYSLFDLVMHHGPPSFYECQTDKTNTTSAQQCRHNATQDIKDPASCFESLCRIIVGQMVSGKAAQAIWLRLLNHCVPEYSEKIKAVTDDQCGLSKTVLLTPESVLNVVSNNGSHSKKIVSDIDLRQLLLSNERTIDDDMIQANLQKPVGLTKNKAASIVDLARRFLDGTLSEKMLLGSKNIKRDEAMVDVADEISSKTIRDQLIEVKGIGKWTCDMFLMFYLEDANLLPLGDLGVRKGLGLYFGYYTEQNKKTSVKVAAKIKTNPVGKKRPSNAIIKMNDEFVLSQLEPYKPYQSLLTYYMWRVADSKIP